MVKHVFRGAYVLAALLMCAAALNADAPVKDDNLVVFYVHVRGPVCSPTNDAVGMITALTPLDTPLFNHNRNGAANPPASCGPILAPDGHQVTLGEFKAAVGRALITCINIGTQSVLHYSGLVPKGTYTVWLAIPPGPPFANIGTLGVTALSENHFQASEAGEGEIVRQTPAENLSAQGSVGPCFLDKPVELHLVYHLDQMTHGFVPGPDSTWVLNAKFLIP